MVGPRERAHETLWTVVVLAVLITVALLVTRSCQDGEDPTGAPTPAGVPAPSGATLVTVVYARDGDTLEVAESAGAGPQQVRLLGIDAPEMHGASGEPQCFAREAYHELRRLAPAGAALWLATDVQRLDPYQRILAYAWTSDGLFVNQELARLGLVRELHIPPNGAHSAELHTAVEEARTARRGLWGICITG